MAFQEQDKIDGWSDYTTWVEHSLWASSILRSECLHTEQFKRDLSHCKSNHQRFRLFWENSKISVEIKKLYLEAKHKTHVIKKVHQQKSNEAKQLDLEKISRPNKIIRNAVDSVDCTYSPEKGRHIVANREIPPGTLIIAEEPFISLLSTERAGIHCHNCLKLLHSQKIICSLCTVTAFCSKECHQLSKDLHDYECRDLLKFQSILGPIYLVLKIMLKIQLNIDEIILQTDEGQVTKSLEEVLTLGPNDFERFHYTNSYSSILLLQDHAEDYDLHSLINNCVTSVFLMHILIDVFGKTNSKLEDTTFQTRVGSVLLRHINQLQVNLVSVLYQNFEDATLTGTKLANVIEYPIGVGVYPTISLFNHSCDPTVTSLFKANRYEARTTRKLEAGQEVTISYGPTYTTETKRDRQLKLKTQYFFECHCATCRDDIENEALALLCPRCDGPVFYSSDFFNKCHRCHAEDVLDIQNCLEKLDECTNSLNKLRQEEDELVKLKGLQELEKDVKKLVFWRHYLLVDLKHELTFTAAATQNSELAMLYSKDELDLSIKSHGENSPELIPHQLTIIHYHWDILESQQVEKLSEEARSAHFRSLLECLDRIRDTVMQIHSMLKAANISESHESMEVELTYLSDTHGEILDHLELQKKSGTIYDKRTKYFEDAYAAARGMTELVSLNRREYD